MQTRIDPYLSFPGTAREAMRFYRDVFGGELTMDTFASFGTDDPALSERIMHSRLETTTGLTLMGADTAPGTEHRPGNHIAVSLSGDDREELRGYWAALSAGGTVTMPMDRQVWGDEFGMCVDPYGIEWMVNINSAEP